MKDQYIINRYSLAFCGLLLIAGIIAKNEELILASVLGVLTMAPFIFKKKGI